MLKLRALNQSKNSAAVDNANNVTRHDSYLGLTVANNQTVFERETSLEEVFTKR